jgi:sugar phosphate isomerase/epimerase
MANWLYGFSKWKFSEHLAPSLVCRSEASLLGLSYPRFARHFAIERFGSEDGLLDERKGGSDSSIVPDQFASVNVRRTEEIEKQRFPSLGDGLRSGVFPANRVNDFGFVADSLFSTPERFGASKGWVVLSTTLGEEFGINLFTDAENRRLNPQLRPSVVPFLQYASYTGGTCTQAVAWICNCLLYSHATTVLSPASISLALRHADRESAETVSFEGLTLPELREYWRIVGLFGQTINLVSDRANERLMIPKLFEAYVNSGMPVIVAVDLYRLNGVRPRTESRAFEGVHAKNKVPKALRYKTDDFASQTNFHVVVVFGSNAHDGDFLIADPATVPFLKVSVEDLINYRSYDDKVFNLMPYLTVQPVTPCEVTLPLLRDTPVDQGLGLIDFLNLENSRVIRSLSEGFDPPAGYTQDFDASRLAEAQRQVAPPTDWHYLLVSKETIGGVFDSIQANPESLSTDSFEAIKDLLDKYPTCFYWVQWKKLDLKGDELILIWNAESKRSEVSKHDLYGVLHFEDGRMSKPHFLRSLTDEIRSTGFVEHRTSPGALGVGGKPTIDRKKVSIQLISSCSVGSGKSSIALLSDVRDALESTEDGVCVLESNRLRVEYYIAMLDDIGFDKHEEYRYCSLSKGLALCRRDNRDFYISWARKTAQMAREKNLLITGFSSFIPEISSFDRPTRDDAVEAILAVHEIAAEFNNCGHAVTYLELVGGSILGPVAGFDHAERTMSLQISSVTEILNNLRTSIVSVENAIDTLVSKTVALPRLKLLLEVEPGLEFVLNHPAVLEVLLDQMSNNIGLNIDIPHYRLAMKDCGTNPGETLRMIRKFKDRIGNVHLSRHSKSHFCDLCFDDKHVDAIDRLLIDAIFFEQPESPFVTVEFEAGRKLGDVVQSVLAVNRYLN